MAETIPRETLLEVPEVFPNRAARTEVKQHIAKALKTTIRGVNRLKLCDKPLESVMKREKKAKKAAEHREKCLNHAEMIKNKQISLKKAAKECGISERQMARYLTKALKETDV